MDKPVILAAREPESFQRVVHYETELRDWFRVYPGWHLDRNREMFRLVRIPSSLPEGLGLEGLREPLDYLLFTLVVYFAEMSAARGGVAGGAGDRFLLSLLAEELAVLVRNRYGGGILDFGDLSHRRSLMRVMYLLERLGALMRLDGSAGDWADRSAAADGLYAFTEVVYQLAPGPAEPEMLSLLEIAETHPGRQPTLATGDPDQRAWRALLLGPALFEIDDPEAYALVERKHSFFGRELADVFDWCLDIRRGMARVLREGHAQDAGYVILSARHRSEYGPVLLFCNLMRARVESGAVTPNPRGCIHLPYSEISSLLLGLRDDHRDLLAGGLGTCKPEELIERTLDVMRENGMARGPDRFHDIYLTPLCALYRGVLAPDEETAMEEAKPHEQLRFFA